MRNAMLLAATALAGLPPIIRIDDPAVSTRRQVPGAVTYRPLSTSSYDATARTVDLIAATETPVRMPGWRIGIEGDFLEVLGMEGADLSAVVSGNVPLIDSHDMYSGLGARLGLITAARIDGGKLVTSAKFGESEAARSAETETASQTPPKVSIGYRVSEYQFVRFDPDRTPVYRATRWALSEVSLVPKAADPNAGVRSSVGGAGPCVVRGETGGTIETSAAHGGNASVVVHAAPSAVEGVSARSTGPTPSEILQLQDQARSLGVEAQVRPAFEAQNATTDSIRATILSAASIRQAANAGGVTSGAVAHVVRDEAETRGSRIQDAILLGIGGQPRRASPRLGQPGEVDTARVEAAREYRDWTISELAAAAIGHRGDIRTVADREAMFGRAFNATGDFPILLTNALNQRLLEAYQVATPVYRRIAQQMTFADFREHDMLRMGDFPQLQAVNESGEIKVGNFKDAKKEGLTVTAYAIRFGLSRQLLVNDRLSGIEQVLAGQGLQVALFEELTFFAMKNANSAGPTLKEDNTRVFTSGHGNLAGSGTAITTAALGAGRAALRKMKNRNGNAMGMAPALLIVSPDKETEAQTILAPLAANQASNINLFSGKLELIVGGQLTGNLWELYMDPAVGSNWAWGLLEGYEAPRLKVEPVFGSQGVNVSLEHDFGCGAQDYRFGYQNGGA